MLQFFKKVLGIFRRGPKEGIYSAICQMAHDSRAKYELESSTGGIRITRQDKKIITITPKIEKGFMVEDYRLDGYHVNVIFGFEEDWMLLNYIQKFLRPDEKAAP